MDFIAFGYNYKNEWWRIALTILLSVLSVFFAQLVAVLIMTVVGGINGNSVAVQEFFADTNAIPAYQKVLLSYGPMLPFLIVFLVCFIKIQSGDVRLLFTVNPRIRIIRIVHASCVMGVCILLSVFYEVVNTDTSFVFNSATFTPYLFTLLIFVPIQVVSEEILFRSYLSQILARIVKYPIIVVLLTSIIFAIIHYGDKQSAESYTVLILSIFISGVVLSVIMILDQGIELCIGIHFINNFLLMIIQRNSNAEGLFLVERESYGWENLLTDTIMYIAMLFLFTKLYHWDWRKLFQKIERPALATDEAQ